MSYVIIFCILIGHISVDSTAADTNPYMNHAVDGILPMKNGETTELPSPDGAETENNWTSSGCNECGLVHGKVSNRLIVGDGKPVKPPNKYPWVVALTRAGISNIKCSGAIINEYFILTAAHCLRNRSNDDMQIIFLSTEPNITKGRRFPVAEIIPHPKFSLKKTGYMYDIGLLKMKEPIQCNEFANPICLPPQNYRHPIGSKMGINGWGRTKYSGPGSPKLIEAEMLIVKEDKCKHFHPNLSVKDMKKYAYCLSLVGNESSCKGDSGGSMITEMDNKYYAIGVMTKVSKYCNDTAVYTSVSSHMDWITEVTGVVPREIGYNNATTESPSTESTSSQARRKPT